MNNTPCTLHKLAILLGAEQYLSVTDRGTFYGLDIKEDKSVKYLSVYEFGASFCFIGIQGNMKTTLGYIVDKPDLELFLDLSEQEQQVILPELYLYVQKIKDLVCELQKE